MGQTIFTTKKMKLESKSWVQKTFIGTIIIAILGAGAFGAYSLVNQSESEPQTSSRSRHQASNYESHSSRNSMLPAYAQKSDPFSSLNGSKSQTSSHSKKSSKFAGTKSKKGKKFASGHGKKHKKHHGKKYAGLKKHKKHKLAAHKKHGKKKIAHQKHGKKKVAHKKHKSGHKLAQR